MAKKRFTFADAKKKISSLEGELARAKKKDFYQGMAWGAGVTALIGIAIQFI